MQVEVYDMEEVNSSEAASMAADATAIDLCERLGLDGQKKLINPDTAERVTFPRVSRLQELVFKTLFPEEARVEQFDTEAIPVRVLEVLEKAKNSGCFVQFKVWHNPTRKDDPILVAHTGKAEPQSWNQHYVTVTGTFLLARWGEALAPFADLCKEAKQVWTAMRRAALRKEIHEKQGELDRLQDDADVAFTTGRTPGSF